MLVQELVLQSKSYSNVVKQTSQTFQIMGRDKEVLGRSREGDKPVLPRQPIGDPVSDTVEIPSTSKRQNEAGSFQADLGEKEGYQYTRDQKRKIQRKQKSVIGKRQGSSIKSGAKYTELFIFHVHNDVQNPDLHAFISGEDINVVSLEQVPHTNARMKCFKLVIETKDIERVLSDDFWPDGIGCRKFMRGRQQKPEDG